MTLKYVESCEGGLNPFIWLRIGQCSVELNEIEKARDNFIRVHGTQKK